MTDMQDRDVQVPEELSEPLTIPVEAYISEEYARAERDRLWRKVWQQVGRVEELPEIGSYLTYDILDDSIIIVRTGANEFRAHHNVCMHRGRRLVDTPRGREERRRPGTQIVRLRIPRLDIRSRRRLHPHPRTGRLEGCADPRRTPTSFPSRSTPGGAAGCSSTWTPTANRWPTTCSRPPRSSTRSGWRTCATSGASGSPSTATGRSRWRPSTRPTTCSPPIRSSTSSANSRAGPSAGQAQQHRLRRAQGHGGHQVQDPAGHRRRPPPRLHRRDADVHLGTDQRDHHRDAGERRQAAGR